MQSQGKNEESSCVVERISSKTSVPRKKSLDLKLLKRDKDGIDY